MKPATLRKCESDTWDDDFSSVGIDVQNPRQLVGGEGLIELRAATLAEDWQFRFPAYQQTETISEEFARLSAEWKEETRFLSSVHEMAMHPAYQRIIGLGAPASSLILHELQRSPDHWFWALRAISGVDPVEPENRGDVLRMCDSWLRWGRDHGLIQ